MYICLCMYVRIYLFCLEVCNTRLEISHPSAQRRVLKLGLGAANGPISNNSCIGSREDAQSESNLLYLVRGLEHFLFSHILGIIIPID